MAIPTYLAMTAGEYAASIQLPQHIAWMACHFSPDGGLCDLPPLLPEGNLLILNDRFPPGNSDPVQIRDKLEQVVTEGKLSGLLLDFERPCDSKTAQILRCLLGLPFPVIVPAGCAKGLDCPVFVPPVPSHIPVREYLQPYQGQQIWLEVALSHSRIRVTKDGTAFSCEEEIGGPFPFWDSTLCCHYRTEVMPSRVEFLLRRRKEDLSALLEQAETYGVTAAVGLYQELGYTQKPLR